jgi:hypothetical protein
VVLDYKYYTDNDTNHCAADLSLDQRFIDFRRFWDNGQGLNRLAELTDLQPKTIYWLRLQCGAATVFATLQTDPGPEAATARLSDIRQNSPLIQSVTAPAAGRKKAKR